jgi:tetratricopeptide (TPR) repeat protein
VVPILMIFAAYALCWLFDALLHKRARELMLAAPALVGFVFLVHHDVVPRDDLSVAHYNLGNKYLKLNRYEDAIGQYHASIAIDPSYISAYNNMAVALEAGGQREPAIVAWGRVLEIARARGLAEHVVVAHRHLRKLEAEREAEGASP